ncbi:hypothetical protein DYB26_011300 [Aphanomyces astaci]|uniref:Uncharacterized protein n=1 Tax=Aphanomyces astaci TaxID=112090 RepID=A0A397ELN0_APHAT|nr:hypothetical protein DYB26_011300 [Aphanomyces astaci]RHY96414.1 hypothetical protein DYB31_003073 [Aphanomyces astaci]
MGDIDAAQDAEFLSLNGIEFIVNCVPREVPNAFEPEGIRSLDKAYEFVKMKRPDIAPHNAYLDQLAMLDAQLQKKHRASEKKRNEWDPLHTDPKTDELVLVNTFLNVTNGIALPHDSAPRKLKKKQLVWIDLCPRMRKLNPHYDFTKLERPPSASYSSLSAESRAVHDVDLSLSDDEQERVTKDEDSWDMSTSDPGLSHDADFDKPLSSWVTARQGPPRLPETRHKPPQVQPQPQQQKPPQMIQPPPLQHQSSFPSQHIKPSHTSKGSTVMPQSSSTLHPPFPSDLSQNQHSPTDKTDEFKLSNNNNNHPRYLQHTKSSRNAKTIKAAQGRYAMPVVDDKPPVVVPVTNNAAAAVPMPATRGVPPKRVSKSSFVMEKEPADSRESTTRLPTTASKQVRQAAPPPPSGATAAVRPKTAPQANHRTTAPKPSTNNQPFKKKQPSAPPTKQPRPPAAPKGLSANNATDVLFKKPPADIKLTTMPPATANITGSMMPPPRRASSAKWR